MNDFELRMICRMDHSNPPTEEQIVDVDYGIAQLNMTKEGMLDMTALFICYQCRPEMRPVKVKRVRNSRTNGTTKAV